MRKNKDQNGKKVNNKINIVVPELQKCCGSGGFSGNVEENKKAAHFP